MTDIPPPISRPPRRDRSSLWPYAAVAAVLLIIVGCLVWAVANKYSVSAVTPAPSAPVHQAQPEMRVTITESTGGKDYVKGNTHGPDMSLSGDKVSGDDLQIKAHDFSLVDVGSISGGVFSGKISASVSGQLWIRILGLLAFIGCGAAAVLSFKKTPLDYHQWGGLAVGSLAGLVVAVQPDLFWVGLGGLGIAAALNFIPSRQSGKTLDAAQWYDDFTESDPDIKAKWIAFRAKMPTSAKTVIDNLIKRTNT